MKELNGKVAVVTGGGSGIGSGICRALAAEGVHLVVSDIDVEAAERLAGTIREGGGKSIGVATDVAQRGAVEELATRTLSEFGGVDIVCNNAGVLAGGPMLESTEDDWQWVLSVNLMGVVHGSQVFAPILLERGAGHIVNTASVGGFLSFPNLATYCTSKFAVVGFSEALYMEIVPRGVAVSILCPGKVHSNLAAGDRLRPAHLTRVGSSSKEIGDLREGMDPLEVGRHVVRGIQRDAAYIFTHGDFRELFEQRFTAVLAAFDATEPDMPERSDH